MTTTHKTPQELMEECQGLVRTLAWKLHRNLPKNVDIEDLIGYGQIGLAEAANSYNPARGVKFSTFAYYRIRGAVYDGLGKMAWFRQAARANQKQQQKFGQMANELLEAKADEQGTSTGADVGGDVTWLKRLTSAMAVVYLTSGQTEQDGGQTQFVDQSAVAPSSELCGQEIRQILNELVDALPKEEGLLIRAAYYEGLTLREAAQRIGISKSWASRLHAKTLQHLAQSLRLLGMTD